MVKEPEQPNAPEDFDLRELRKFHISLAQYPNVSEERSSSIFMVSYPKQRKIAENLNISQLLCVKI
jgi:hypothetical protein